MQIDRRLVVVVVVVVLGGMMGGYKAVKNSKLIGRKYRYNLVVASSEGGVRFVSFDPEQREVLSLRWPGELRIRSRSVGSYQVSDLYRLGSYEDQAGEFVRIKMQGFMKLPMMSFLEIEDNKMNVVKGLLRRIWSRKENTSITRLDAVILISKYLVYQEKQIDIPELIRAGVLSVGEDEIYSYQPKRLQSYLGSRVFDWGVGRLELTVAVVNESGITGLATETAEFLENVGLDVVAVRSGKGEVEKTRIMIDDEVREEKMGMIETLAEWFGWEEGDKDDVDEYRAELVVFLGKDAVELF